MLRPVGAGCNAPSKNNFKWFGHLVGPIIGHRDPCFTVSKSLSETVGNPQTIANSASFFFVFLRFSSFFAHFSHECARLYTKNTQNEQ
jgi:hypothetical protein